MPQGTGYRVQGSGDKRNRNISRKDAKSLKKLDTYPTPHKLRRDKLNADLRLFSADYADPPSHKAMAGLFTQILRQPQKTLVGAGPVAARIRRGEYFNTKVTKITKSTKEKSQNIIRNCRYITTVNTD